MFEALNQRTSFMLLVLSSSLLPSQQPLVLSTLVDAIPLLRRQTKA